MQKANAVRKKPRGWAYGNGRAHAIYWWVATCPSCGIPMQGTRTRKKAKDELYRHRRNDH